MKFYLAPLVVFITIGSLKAQKDTVNHMPEIDGVIRAKYEYNFMTEKGRFDVRNARYKVSGLVVKGFGYKAEIDLSDEGEIKMLDANVFYSPLQDLTVTMGQVKIPFSTDHLRSPAELAFSNRSFINKRICKNLRDIGFMMTYKKKDKIPYELVFGIFNGKGVNNPEWTNTYNVGARAVVEPLKGVQLSGNYHGGKMDTLNLQMFDAGINYRLKNWFFDTEYAIKFTTYHDQEFNAAAFFGYVTYDINLKPECFVRRITPGIRYDFYDSDIYSTGFEPGRLTGGITFGFAKLTFANIRIDYEKYMYQDAVNLDDKITLEFIARF